MKTRTRVIAAALAVTMMVPVFSGCKKNRGGEKISADDPWFELTTISINSETNSEDFQYVYNNFIGTFDGGYAFRKMGTLKLPDGTDPETVDMRDYSVDELNTFGADGNLVNSFDLLQLVDQLDGDYNSVSGVTQVDGGFNVELVSTNYNTGNSTYYTSFIDVTAGTIGEITERTGSGVAARLLEEGASDEGVTRLGDYSIQKFWFSSDATGSINSYDVVVTDSNGNSDEFDMRILYPSTDIFNISTFIDIGNNQFLMCASSSDFGNAYYIIDMNSKTMSVENSDMSWLDNKIYMIRQVDGTGSVLIDDDGIYTIDYPNKTFVPLFLYTSTNVNACQIGSLTPVYVSADRAVFTGTEYNPNPGYTPNDNVLVFEFNRADTNPNAGKTILDIACVGYLSYPLCEAVCNFNGSNPDYFLRFDMSYQIDVNYAEGDANENEDIAATSLGNQLSMDIMSGTGPDIIVNGSKFGMLNNSEYLLDMSEFVSQNCGSDSYYTNILDSAKIDGELFQIPLCFSIEGIVTDASNVEPGQTGFTFDQYAQFVSGPCNGTDPMGAGRMNFFLTSLNCMTDLMNEDQVVNYDNEAFRALAEYVAQNVNEALPSDEEGMYIEEEPVASLRMIPNVSSYFNAINNGQFILLGIPSYDGRGPVITSSDSVAISAQTIAPDACREFVSLLLTEEIQELYGSQRGLPISRAAFDSVGSKYVETYNRDIDNYRRTMTEAQMRQAGFSTDYMDESLVTELAQMVETLNGWYINDGSINAIIREEMPAYFEGQKTLEQIIPVLEDRVQTVINERR